MIKSTPGPWEAITNRPHEEHKWMTANRSWSNWPISTGMTKADAHLIASAPEMLELLKLVHGSFAGGLTMTFSEQDVEEFTRVLKKAQGGEE